MTIEEKAKAYDEALKVLHKYDGANIVLSQSLKEEMFPELAESEDERIRKEMIKVIRKEAKEFPSSIIAENASSWIAWLEKQGEQKLLIEKLPEEMKTIGESLGFTTQEESDKYNQMVSDLIMSDGNKGEQKSAWSEEDDRILNGLISSLARIGANTRTDSTSINYTFPREINWLKSLKQRIGG